MTCAQMGGPCDIQLTANTPKEMIDQGIKHLEKYHPDMFKDMKKMTPEENKKWNDDFMKKWDMTKDISAGSDEDTEDEG